MFAAVISLDYLLLFPPVQANYICCHQAAGGLCNGGQMKESPHQTVLRGRKPKGN